MDKKPINEAIEELRKEINVIAVAAHQPRKPIWTEVATVGLAAIGIVAGLIPLYMKANELESKAENLHFKATQETEIRKVEVQKLEDVSKNLREAVKTLQPFPSEPENFKIPHQAQNERALIPTQQVKGEIVFSPESRPVLYKGILKLFVSDFSSSIIELTVEELFKYDVFRNKSQLTPEMKVFFNEVLKSDLTIYNRTSQRLEIPGFSYSSIDGTTLKWGMNDA